MARLLLLTVVFALALSSAGCAPSAPETLPTPTSGSAPPTSTALGVALTATSLRSTGLRTSVDVGGYKLEIMCLGSGTPTVVLENGLGASWDDWGGVMRMVAKYTRVCGYDRANTGMSDHAPKPRTSQQMVADLHTLLMKVGETRPYILAGASIGGWNVRLYAHDYPQDVVGMVLVDSSHPDMFSRYLAALPPESAKETDALKQLRKDLTTFPQDPAQNPEGMDLRASAAQVRATGSLGDIPLVVLTATEHGDPLEVKERFWQVWLGLQKELAQLSSRSTHTIVPNSPHPLVGTHDKEVADAIRAVIDAVRGK